MKLENVKIIEDRHNLLGTKIKTITECRMYTPVMDIQAIEEWEDRLDFLGIPYILVAVDDGYVICKE